MFQKKRLRISYKVQYLVRKVYNLKNNARKVIKK